MDDQQTCGEGLAANAELPATVGELMAAMAGVLHEHQQALDLIDQNTKPEHHAYNTLVLELRTISAQLALTARHMADYHDLPMGRHDERKMSSREAVTVFERFVQAERALLTVVTRSVAEHESMLEQLRQDIS